jgi:hypothetical protein
VIALRWKFEDWVTTDLVGCSIVDRLTGGNCHFAVLSIGDYGAYYNGARWLEHCPHCSSCLEGVEMFASFGLLYIESYHHWTR